MKVVLVHGAWSSAALWGEVPALLAAHGHRVHALDLPGHGASTVAPETVTLADYGAALAEHLAGAAPAVLVGHSMGGMAISAAAELVPERVAGLIYVAAFLPRDGDSLVSLKRREPETIGVAVRRSEGRGTTVLDPTSAADFLFQDAPPDLRDAALARLGPQSNAAQTDRISLTGGRFGRIPRDFVVCTGDRTVTPWLQRRMCAESPCRRVVELPSGHFPQLTMPARLAETLADLLG